MQKKAQKQMKKMGETIKERVEKNFILKHPVGSQVAGITIFDIARNEKGEKFIIVPLYDFATYIHDNKTLSEV